MPSYENICMSYNILSEYYQMSDMRMASLINFKKKIGNKCVIFNVYVEITN